MKNDKSIKVLITGAGGLTGKTATEYFKTQTNYQIFPLSRQDLDITDAIAVQKTISGLQPDFVLNCAAFTQVDLAEIKKAQCYAVNVTGVKNLATASHQTGSTLIHLSTDYVFDGAKRSPYSENDPKNPLNYYGLTKSQAEDIIPQLTSRYFIIRPAWIYGKYGNNFFKLVLKLAEENDVLKISNDQINTPTYARDLVEFIHFIIQHAQDEYGLYHFSNEGQTTRYEQAKEILKLLGKSNKIIPVDSSEFNPIAKRPPYSVLSKAKIKNKWHYPVKHWKESLHTFIKTYYDYKS